MACPATLLAAWPERMFPEDHDAGFVFFRPGEAADRIYVIADGDVSLIDATGESDESVLLQAGEEFGSLSFVCGMRHTATAIAHTMTEVWVLRRSDLDELVARNHAIRSALAEFLGSHRVGEYLERDQELDADKVAGSAPQGTGDRSSAARCRRRSAPRSP